MKGIGKSIRENAKAGYLYHCRQAAKRILQVQHWPWSDWAEAFSLAGGFLVAVACLILCPIIIPIAGYTRHRHYRREMADWAARQAKVDDLHK